MCSLSYLPHLLLCNRKAHVSGQPYLPRQQRGAFYYCCYYYFSCHHHYHQFQGQTHDLNGQVSNRILEQVPDRARFCELLALVRYWAQQRGVFGSPA